MSENQSNNSKTITLDGFGDLLSPHDLSVFLGVSKQTVYKEIKDGKFGAPIKFGRSYRIPKVYIQQRYLVGYVDDEV
ncbi:MAG: helix-turn-helix domain-containing protein [Defluviitaleaceae bacterium]|nr:helix-turn-helix domain-containing protein [Defluviitaleaceae bacterium]